MGLSLDIACEQALRAALAAGREKDGELATTSMRNTYWWRWHLVMMSLPLARVFQCLFIYAVVSALRWMAEIWQISRRGATGELEMEFKLQRRRALSIYQTLWETSMERSIERRTCELTQVPFAEMVSSPKFKMVAQISPWIAWNCWFLSKIRKWNMHFHWKVSKAKTGLRFQFSSYSLDFSSRMPSKSKFIYISSGISCWDAKRP